MHRIIVTILFLLPSLAGCKTAGKPRPSSDGQAGNRMTSIILSLTEENPEISQRPFQFRMHRNADDPLPVMATNRSAKALRYVAENQGLNIPVTPAAIHCMGKIFSAIDQAQLQDSEVWQQFRSAYPYRFLEILPELHDFHTFYNEKKVASEKQVEAERWTRPALWAGLAAANTPSPGETGFRVRGYLKWSGVLLEDGVTCLISRKEDINQLLSDAMSCERGNDANCTIVTEDNE